MILFRIAIHTLSTSVNSKLVN